MITSASRPTTCSATSSAATRASRRRPRSFQAPQQRARGARVREGRVALEAKAIRLPRALQASLDRPCRRRATACAQRSVGRRSSSGTQRRAVGRPAISRRSDAGSKRSTSHPRTLRSRESHVCAGFVVLQRTCRSRRARQASRPRQSARCLARYAGCRPPRAAAQGLRCRATPPRSGSRRPARGHRARRGTYPGGSGGLPSAR